MIPQFLKRNIELKMSDRVVPLKLPEAKQGKFIIEKKTFEAEIKLNMTMSANTVSFPEEITITILKEVKEGHQRLWMSDSPSELRDMKNLIQEAEGKVLVAGLGMGLVSAMLIDKDEVDEIVIVELNQEVIDLIGKHVLMKGKAKRKSVSIIQANINYWVAGKDLKEFDSAILDIWGDVSSDDLDTMLPLWRVIRNSSPDIKGAIWGLDMAVESIMGYCRGYCNSEEMADAIEFRYEHLFWLADYIRGNYYWFDENSENDNEDDEMNWVDYEEEAVSEAFYDYCGLIV